MSENSGKSTVELRDEIVDDLLDTASSPKYEGSPPRVRQLDGDDTDDCRAFLEVAFKNIVSKIAENRTRYEADVGPAEETLVDIFDESNIEDIDVRSNGWASPSVRVWLNNAPVWANDSWREEFKYSVEREHYNGNPAHAVLDVRPF